MLRHLRLSRRLELPPAGSSSPASHPVSIPGRRRLLLLLFLVLGIALSVYVYVVMN